MPVLRIRAALDYSRRRMSADAPYPSASQANSESVAGIAIALNVGNVAQPPASARERFAAEELAMVLSHYDLGVIRDVREFPRGSRRAPKLYLAAESGEYLLKRRARGRDDLQKVTFSHLVQLHLAAQQFPLPHLIGTRNDNHSMVRLETGIYELFEFIPGQNFPQTLDATAEAGRVQALYHKLLEGFHAEDRPNPGSFHAAPSVEQGLRHIPKVIPGAEAVILCNELGDAYRAAGARVETLGISGWPSQIVHGDWHPGNLLFRESRVAAVIDYDSSRLLPRILDAANGALQFSILGGGDDLTKWPANIDTERFKRFIRGYDEVVLLSQAEIDAVPWLMIEALVAEAVFPIAQTGRFSRFDGLAFLKMVQRKIAWVTKHADELVRLLGE